MFSFTSEWALYTKESNSMDTHIAQLHNLPEGRSVSIIVNDCLWRRGQQALDARHKIVHVAHATPSLLESHEAHV